MVGELHQVINKTECKRLVDFIGSEPCPQSRTKSQAWYAKRARGLTIPTDVLLLLACNDGSCLNSEWEFNLLQDDIFDEYNNSREYLYEDLPSAVFFASDNRDGFFFVDTDGRLGFGIGSIYWVDGSTTMPGNCVFCAASILEFLQALQQGEKPWRGPKLSSKGVQDLIEVLKNHPRHWCSNVGARISKVSLTEMNHQIFIPNVLKELLLLSNGLLFPASHVRIFSLQELYPLEQTCKDGTRVPAYVFAKDEFDNLLTITVQTHAQNIPPGWPLTEGIVVQIGRDCLIEQGIVLGPLSEIILNWLGI